MLNMPYTTYVNYEKGLREPTSEVLIQIADFFDVTIDYLLGRSNNQHHVPTNQTRISTEHNLQISSPALDLTDEEIVLVRKYRCLDERGQASVRNILDHEYNSLPGEKAISHTKKA